VYEIRYLTENGLEKVVELADLDEVKKFYRDLPPKCSTLSFKSLESGRTVE
jgi:hypothetical protein